MPKTPAQPASTADLKTQYVHLNATAKEMHALLRDQKKKVDAFHVAALDFIDAAEAFMAEVRRGK